jgi:hypothetical protein
MTETQRKQAFALCAVFLAAVVAALSLTRGGQGDRPAPQADRAARGDVAASDAPLSPGVGDQTAAAPSTDADPAAAPPTERAADAAPVDPDAQRPTLPAGQAPQAGSRAAPSQPAGAEAPAAVEALARRFVEAYLVYELGRPASTQRRVLSLTSGGALRRELLRHPPRAPLGVPLARARLSTIDGIAARGRGGTPSRYDVSYTLRRGGRYELHAIEVSRRAGRWLVTSLLG